MRFRGERFIAVGVDAALTTPEAYARGDGSYAHLYADGRVLRHGVQIGRREELEWTGEWIEVEPDAKAPGKLLYRLMRLLRHD